MSYFYNKTSNNALGGSDLQVYVTDPVLVYVNQIAENIDEAIQNALDKVVDESGGITYESKPLNEISNSKPNTGDINMNNKRISNLATLPGLSIEEIIATPNVAVNVQTCSNLITANLALNTAYCGPLFSTMDVKNKRITNIADALLIEPGIDPQAQDKLQQAVTLGNINELCITTAPEDRLNYYINDKRIYELGDALFYKNSDILTLPDPLQPNQFLPNPSDIEKYKRQAVNVDSIQLNCVCLDRIDRANFDSLSKQIKNGKQATDAKDYVTLDQVLHEELKEIEWIESDPVPLTKTSKYIFEDDRVLMCSNPKEPVGGFFTIQGTNPPSFVNGQKQIVNVAYMNDKCRLKNNDINLDRTSRVLGCPDPTDQYEAVHKTYCDGNSGKTTGGGNLFSTIFGAIAGAVSGALSSFATQGLASGFGSIASTGAAAFGSFLSSGLFQGGMRVGSQAGLEALKTNNPIPNEGALIDNLKDDIANRPQGQPDVATLVSGAMSVSGLFRAVQNAQIGLFDLVN